ncbi:hypothetical protein BU15DRAFT_76390 [Melanogaster broomeanus]|nr:hypothetical protein BU15DRAFT_76390 [Melanogaster broomeanus]
MATTKRTLVPAALHAELTEYTNLIRALRTSRTLDLTTHLLEHAAQQRQQVDEGQEKSTERDTWTPWPLIDFPVPEWSFEDEIRQLGESVARQMEGWEAGANSDEDGNDNEEGADLDLLPPPVTNLLVEHAGSILVHVLNAMADQRPSTAGSMQNRLWAMNWEDVISVLAVSGVVDKRVILRAGKRLQQIYGPFHTKAAKRMHLAESARTKFLKTISNHDDILLEFPVQRHRACHIQHGTKRKNSKGHRKQRIVSKDIIETDSDE